MPLFLSKSQYCLAVQCSKMLWLKKHKSDVFDSSVMNEVVLENGNMIGDLAMSLFGEYVEVPHEEKLSDMLRITDELMEKTTPIITEASFTYKGLFCSVDILINQGEHKVQLYEVKSSTTVHDIYIDDVAFQTYVLSKLGYKVEKSSLVYINSDYVRHGELNISELFKIEDVTEIVGEKLLQVEEKITHLEEFVNQKDEPFYDIGEHCFKPYKCGFWDYCTKHMQKPNVFDIAGAKNVTKLKYYKQGIISFNELDKCDSLNDGQYMQVHHEVNHYPAYIDKEGIRKFLKSIRYPLYFLDFESFQPAVPLFDDSKPYEQIVFQYSLHYLESEGGELKHKEFLAYPGEDPRKALAEQLCKDIPQDVCTTAYNMGFEKGRIKRLAELYPELSEHLMNIHDHIVDLMIPFQKKMYYAYEMKGSYSIKYVLPALFPREPSLDYHNLEGVHNGSEASAIYAKMSNMSKDELEKQRGYLLKYCGLDTFAMIKVWEKLCEVTGIALIKTW